mmetsp:Transcript_16005/g.49759  ORF Transcript_16005/g.49759 Transcript_16005/m.49759 type:complete len:243 (+) Transcript_16005:766-1494(+)
MRVGLRRQLCSGGLAGAQSAGARGGAVGGARRAAAATSAALRARAARCRLHDRLCADGRGGAAAGCDAGYAQGPFRLGAQRQGQGRAARGGPGRHHGPRAPGRAGGRPEPEIDALARASRARHRRAARNALPAARRGYAGLRGGARAASVGRAHGDVHRLRARELFEPRAAEPVQLRGLQGRRTAKGAGCGRSTPGYLPRHRCTPRGADNPHAGPSCRRGGLGPGNEGAAGCGAAAGADRVA